jgi:hypothetical protein
MLVQVVQMLKRLKVRNNVQSKQPLFSSSVIMFQAALYKMET